MLRFRNVANLLRVEDRLMTILKSISCLITIAHVNSETVASQLIDFVTTFRMAQKYLTIFNSNLNVTFLENKTINFNVMLHHFGPGANRQKYTYSQYIQKKICVFHRWKSCKHISMSHIGEDSCCSVYWAMSKTFRKSLWKRAENIFYWFSTIHILQSCWW